MQTEIPISKVRAFLSKFDGFFFLPIYDEDIHVDYKIDLFEFNEKKLKSKKIEHTEIGDMYHIAFFKIDNDTFKYDESFEAIFVDPLTYVKNLIGSNLHGIMVRKTKKSTKWFNQVLTNLKNDVKIDSITSKG
jgi:hypothetical protein